MFTCSHWRLVHPHIFWVFTILSLTAHDIRCGHFLRLHPSDTSSQRQFAPDRQVDIEHVRLDVTPDFVHRTITAQTHLKFRPLTLPVREVKLDAVDLRIDRVESSESIKGWQNTDRQLIVTYESDLPPDRPITLTVHYRAEPAEGLYFRTPEMGYPAGDTHLFTQGQAITHRHWFPCFDAPNEKFTSEIICRVPQGMTVLSNGRLLSENQDAATGLVTFHWLQDKPHVNYLIAIAAGYFETLEADYRGIPLTFHTPPSEFQWAPNSFAGTRNMMAFFEQEIGVAYPWSRYAQVCVHDFIAGGMENTTLTILTMDTLFPPETENLRSSQHLVAHELAHQWFGDLVTCKDWSHLWLNEGFATYYDVLFEEHQHGRDRMLHTLWQRAQEVLQVQDDTTPMVWRGFAHPDEQFSFRAYPKGAWVLHMLRSQLGESLFRRCIQTWVERHAYGLVVTQDLNAVIEELSGRSFDQFFDQWVYHAGHPKLRIGYAWDEQTHLARLSVRQTQTINEHVLLFRLPLPVRFFTPSGVITRTLDVQQAAEDFYILLPAAPQRVRIDPEFTLLAELELDLPNDLLYAQLEAPDDMMGRLTAVNILAGQSSQETLERLTHRLKHDPFPGVRIEASKALRHAHTDAARESLLASREQPDAQVRLQVFEDLGAFHHESVRTAALNAIESERNPDIIAKAVDILAAHASPETRSVLLRLLAQHSFRNVVTDAAIKSMRSQDDPAFVEPLLHLLRTEPSRFTTPGFGNALRALAYLARNDADKTVVRELLVDQLNAVKLLQRQAAIEALGTLGDPKAIAILEPLTRLHPNSPLRQVAATAIDAIRSFRRPAENLQDLQNELRALRQLTGELSADLLDLKKQFQESQTAIPH